MLLSRFTPCGMLQMRAGTPLAESIYGGMIASVGGAAHGTAGNYALGAGEREEATLYAQAMALAEADLLLQHAGLQLVPECVAEMMGEREWERDIVPSAGSSLPERRAVLAARTLLPRGARREAVVDALGTLLGDAFVGLLTCPTGERVTWPAALGAQPQSLAAASVPRKLVRLPGGVSVGLGMVQQVAYVAEEPAGVVLLAGDTVLVEPEISGRAERVAVVAVGAGVFRGVFQNAHEPDCLATTQPWPIWTSSQRFSLIVVRGAGAVDPETRRQVDDLMGRLARGVSTWEVVAETDPRVCGPFVLDQSPLTATPFGLFALP